MKKSAFSFLVLYIICFTGLAQDDLLEITYENTSEGVQVYARNKGFCPFTLDISVEATNLVTQDNFPLYRVIEPSNKKVPVTSLTIENRKKGYQFGYEYTYYKGNAIDANVDKEYVYQLPYAPGEKYYMSQGYGGEFSHEDKLALDFTMPVDTRVLAAREGTVIDVKQDSNKGCPDESCLHTANFITVYHEDESFAEYTHLRKKGSLVKPGDKIRKGQHIGYSGDTGYSSGPHLHFEVYYYRLSKQIGVPTKFRTNRGKVEYLEEMVEYTAPGN